MLVCGLFNFSRFKCILSDCNMFVFVEIVLLDKIIIFNLVLNSFVKRDISITHDVNN